MDKPLLTLLREIQEHRKWQHRSFTRHSDGDTYIVLMFAHDAENDLCVIVGNAALPQIKEVVKIEAFKTDFVQQVEHSQPVITRGA